MAGFATYDQIINALTTGKGQLIFFQKPSLTSIAANWYRLWNITGFPGAGADPSPALQGIVPTKDTAGAMPIRNPTSPATLHMLSFGAGGAVLGSLMLYDRLWHVGGISLTINTLQSFTGVIAPTRHSDGVGNQLLVEITTATTATAATLTVNYTNTLDQSKQATIALAAAEPVNRCYFLNLAAGDLGIKTIVSCQLSVAKTAGVANLVLFNSEETVVVPWAAAQWTERDLVLQMANLPRILDNACLTLMIFASTTSTGLMAGRLQLAEN